MRAEALTVGLIHAPSTRRQASSTMHIVRVAHTYTVKFFCVELFMSRGEIGTGTINDRGVSRANLRANLFV